MIIDPIAAPLLRFITEELPVHDDPAAPLFPRSHENVQRLGRVESLSRQFHELLVKARLLAPQQRQAKEEGSKRRTVHTLSFHSLRHTITSLSEKCRRKQCHRHGRRRPSIDRHIDALHDY